MIYLLYGSDIVKSRQKLNEIIDEYHDKAGSDLNLYRIDAEEENEGKLREVLETGSLFSAKKLVVVKYFSDSPWGRDQFYKLLEGTKDDSGTTLLLWDRELSEKDVKNLAPYCRKVQEFKSLRREEPEPSIFRLGDTFFTSSREGLRSLMELLHHGHDDFNLFSYLSNHARTLLTVSHYAENKKPVPSKHGIHPFVIKKASAIVRAISSGRLHQVFQRFFEEDYKIKTGGAKPRDSLFSLLLNQSREP